MRVVPPATTLPHTPARRWGRASVCTSENADMWSAPGRFVFLMGQGIQHDHRDRFLGLDHGLGAAARRPAGELAGAQETGQSGSPGNLWVWQCGLE